MAEKEEEQRYSGKLSGRDSRKQHFFHTTESTDSHKGRQKAEIAGEHSNL